ncbi:beta-N-acetylhexosaminidase [Streptomyces sp. AN091965]|uniref:beta-N-acetylhexosaminidase n=1 Tax=Streptomyces sp. AN091965 TaxID=2927803 RepID=UPI001F61CD52|nr:beta-N-acetylhexosaminidase [Streptomyces sp. AN091965]MCI3930832.1 beta-N-acetylhexosaminidase [Streptomyces sp. AN091965]
MRKDHRPTRVIGSLLLIAAAGLSTAAVAPGGERRPAAAPTPLGRIIPAPLKAEAYGPGYEITAETRIRVGDHPEERRVGEYLARLLRPATGFRLPVTDRAGRDGIRLRIGAGHADLGNFGNFGNFDNKALGREGYRLISERRSLTLTSWSGAGLFHSVQTLRQQLPAAVERTSPQRGPWRIAGGTIEDTPRYAYRGAMLDVSRHFFPVGQVKRFVDQLALYKMNTLHLHLSDDQGWRIAVDSWPRLAEYGGSTQVGGGPGGHYTKEQYREIVSYAASRGLEVIPEIDMPSHTNAALASYAELNCDGVAPPLYTGTEVGFSSLCVHKDVTYDFVDDVIRELAALTPGRYLHIGGDEAHSTSHEDFVTFMTKVQPIVAKYGKTVLAWHQLTEATPAPGAVAQYWGYDRTGQAERDRVVNAARGGTGLVLSPADRSYLDHKYDKDTPLGLKWAGYVDVRRAYDWDPGSYLPGAPADAILGVEAPLWTETLSSTAHLDYMAFPRLPGIAELGWSPATSHGWEPYRARLAEQAPRWDALGIGYFRSPQVPWPGH